MRHSSQNANSLPQGLYSHQNPRSVGCLSSHPSGGFVEVDAFAKINLFLAVVGKKEDGYHELATVMQAIDLCDHLIIKTRGAGQNLVRLKTNSPKIPTDDRNLVVKAAKLFMRETGAAKPIDVKLIKRIPMGAGLGGGSSDAAATLLGLNRLFNLHVPMEDLMAMGKSLGADVPFCLLANTTGGAALAKGIGEKLTPLQAQPKGYLVLACPKIHVSTKDIFKRLGFDPNAQNKGAVQTQSILAQLDKFMAAYNSGDISQMAKHFYNTFTPVSAGLHPQIATLIADLQHQGALGAAMTGTGATVFAYFNSKNSAQAACSALHKKYHDTKFVVTQHMDHPV